MEELQARLLISINITEIPYCQIQKAAMTSKVHHCTNAIVRLVS